MRTIWDNVCSQLLALGRLEDKDLNSLERLVSAGFKSRHRHVVNKMAETWNALVKDEENLDCSDSLKSIIASLRPMVDVSFPGMEESSGEFGAQVQSFVDSQEDMSFIALSSAKSSGHGVDQAASPVPSITKMSLRGATTRKRRRDATPEAVRMKPAKRTNTPRLRHDNSQIQFAPIVSSPLAEESQHLTERQKEVRQRQQENAVLYPSIKSSPRTRSRAALEEQENESDAKKTRNLETTPERPASYEDFITSTPTPRRGQALQMEGFNDPPSSPPDPRRNPLLSEIQTRSKAKSSLESWQFSSPPGSPPTSQPPPESQPEPPAPSTTKKSGKSSRSKRRRKSRASSLANEEVIPSSVSVEEDVTDLSILPDADDLVDVEEQKEESGESPTEEHPTTPPQAMSPVAQVQETPKSGDDEFVDARSSPGEASNEQPPAAPVEVVSSQNQDSSFALSEGDESSLMRFVVELESRRCNLPFDKVNSASASPEKIRTGPQCIEVQGDSSPEKQSMTKRSLSPPVIPSTPVGAGSENSDNQGQSHSKSQGGSKRKRKRSAKIETLRKRRRPADPRGSDQGEESQQISQDAGSPIPTPSIRRSSRRNAGQKGKKLQDKDTQAPSTAESPTPQAKSTAEKSNDAAGVRDGGDTDEELMSQLVTESFAASQSQQEEEPEMPSAVIEDSMDVVSAEDESPSEVADEAAKAESEEEPETGKSNTIMDILRGGLDQLRGAALSREDVYQLEDMLMDMKRELFEAERRGRR